MTARDPSELPPEDQPDLEHEAMLKVMGLMHISEALAMDGDFQRIKEQTLDELGDAITEAILSNENWSEGELEARVSELIAGQLEVLDERLEEAGLPTRKDVEMNGGPGSETE